ncbi:MAG: hypothetical protein AAF550_09625, partial [Myxococcota bacterium]
MSEIDRQIHARIHTFVDELNDLVRQAAIDAVAEAITGTSVRAKPVSISSRAPIERKGRRRSSEAMDKARKALLAYIEANPGVRMEQIGVGLKTPTKELARPLKQLLTEGALRR